MSRAVGIDYGMARIGLAISDENKIVARSLKTLSTSKKLEDTVKALLDELKEFAIDLIVIGFPLQMDGRIGILADEVKHFIELLRKATACEVIAWDERLTTRQADQILRQADLTRKKRKKSVDAVSAIIILQSYLDSLENTLIPEESVFDS